MEQVQEFGLSASFAGKADTLEGAGIRLRLAKTRHSDAVGWEPSTASGEEVRQHGPLSPLPTSAVPQLQAHVLRVVLVRPRSMWEPPTEPILNARVG